MPKLNNPNYLGLRIQWFKLKAKEFIQRYAAGLMVIAILLPGITIGDNLKIFLSALTQPLLITSATSKPFLIQFVWGLTLFTAFLVWVKSQKSAIDGGAFNQYLKSINLGTTKVIRTNWILIFIANHFLWIFILFGLSSLISSETMPYIHIIRYVVLISILLLAQYTVIFSTPFNLSLSLNMILFLFLMLILPLPSEVEWIRLTLLTVALLWKIKSNHQQKTINNHRNKNKFIGKQNLYFQMLFKASLASTCFRIVLIIALMAGFVLTADHFKTINDGTIKPHSSILAALMAFFLSGFFLLFKDQRLSMSYFLNTLPIPHYYWVKRDFLTVLLISICLQLPYIFWQLNHFSQLTILKNFVFQSALLLISYPLRVNSNESTFSTFITLTVISIFYIYNFT